MKKKNKKDIYSFKNIFIHFIIDLIAIVFDPRDGSPSDAINEDWPNPEFEEAFNNKYCKKKYGEIWGFFILIIDLIIAINTHIWKIKQVNLFFILLVISFIVALFLINRGLLADKEKELN